MHIGMLALLLDGKVQNVPMDMEAELNKQVHEAKSTHRWMIYFIININKTATEMTAIMEFVPKALNGMWAIPHLAFQKLSSTTFLETEIIKYA